MAELSDEVRGYFSKLGKRSAENLNEQERKDRASRAGKGNNDKLTDDERSERAKKAAAARWAKKAAKKKKAE